MSAADGQQKTTATTTVTNKTTKTAAAPIVIIKEEKMDTPAAADATAAPPTMTTATAATTTNNKTVNNNNNNNTADSEQMADDLLLGGGDDDGQNEEDNCMADDSVLDMLTDADTAAISADVAAAAAAAASALAVNEDKETGAAAAVVVAEAAADGIEDIIIDEYVNEESDGGGGSSGGDADNTAGADKDQEVVDLGSDNEGDDGGGGRISVTTPGISGDDNELRTAGLKTSLMLSEEKNQKLEKKIKELEDELRRVYQHLINATEDKKKMDIKCRTLEEQLDRIVAGGGGDNGARHESRLQDRPDKKKMSPKSALFQSPAAKQSRPMNTNSEYGGNKKVGFAAGGGGNQPIGRQNYGQSFGDKFERRMPLSGNSGSGNYNNNNDNNSRRQLHPSAYKQPPHHRQQQQAPPPPPPQPSNTGAIGHQQITELSARLRIPDHVDRKAHELFEQFHTCPQIMDMCYKTRIRPSIAAAFISSRLTDYFGFSMRKLNEVVPTDRSALLECCAFIVDFLRINCSLLNASDLVKGFCKDLEIPPALEKAVNHVTKRAFAARSDWGRDPALVAAAATYLISQASHHKRPLTALAGVSGLAEANIGSAYLKMRVMVEQLVPPDFVFNTPIHMLPL
ncbi:uncharacterized protein LOC128951178 [Oppia nitens]|uniref:uncharacterized protein LOC128951178 n=1 Tax=Oppia nitens TaxID=1686743 RepID=UPI0023D9E9E4|nr:uncharacterized protein LOC128951178 [Oppia nitens]XP_054152412.1 uncharacterized protein LOC128951178 [Oppia nitens]